MKNDVSLVEENWSTAYARQAQSDLRVREKLVVAGVERCHALHYLQMAAEKTCKAHLSAGNGNKDVRRTHAYVASVLPVIARVFYPRMNESAELQRWQLAEVRRLATEIELLAPACDAGEVRNDNSEYPWQGAQGQVETPCEYGFPNIEGGKTLTLVIKLLRVAAASYAQVIE